MSANMAPLAFHSASTKNSPLRPLLYRNFKARILCVGEVGGVGEGRLVQRGGGGALLPACVMFGLQCRSLSGSWTWWSVGSEVFLYSFIKLHFHNHSVEIPQMWRNAVSSKELKQINTDVCADLIFFFTISTRIRKRPRSYMLHNLLFCRKFLQSVIESGRNIYRVRLGLNSILHRVQKNKLRKHL